MYKSFLIKYLIFHVSNNYVLIIRENAGICKKKIRSKDRIYCNRKELYLRFIEKNIHISIYMIVEITYIVYHNRKKKTRKLLTKYLSGVNLKYKYAYYTYIIKENREVGITYEKKKSIFNNDNGSNLCRA